jgi:N-glycosylase/DNA lyase
MFLREYRGARKAHEGFGPAAEPPGVNVVSRNPENPEMTMLPGMEVIRLREDQPLDLGLTLSCGQAFRWELKGRWWEGVVGDGLWRLRQAGTRIICDGLTAEVARNYLGLNEDLPLILSSIDRDPVIHRSIEACRGLRILRQDPWEILISFICATNTNIPRIRKMIATLAT